MRDVLWLMQKTMRTTFRSKKNIVFYLLTPLVGIIVAIVAYGNQDDTMTVGVVNEDQTAIADETVDYLQKLDNVNVKAVSAEKINASVTAGDVDGVVTLDKGFSDSIQNGEPSHITMTSIKGDSATNLIKSYLYPYIDNLTAIGKAADGDADLFKQMKITYQKNDFQLTTKPVKNIGASQTMGLSTLGFLIMIMMMSATNLSEIILKEKEEQTYFRLLSTPITARKYILSNVLVNMIVMMIQVALTLLFLQYVFDVDLHIPFWQGLIVMGIFSLISVGVSLVIVAFSNSRKSSNALSMLVIMPTVMLSGCFWPVEVMPDTIQNVSKFLPQRWTLDTLTELQNGSGFADLYLNLFILGAFALALFLVAVYKFSRHHSTTSIV